MSYFYSATTRGFYHEDIHGERVPRDVVEISDEEHAALLAGQSAGKVISHDRSGRPVLIERPGSADMT